MKRALVLSGGGSKGAFEVGAIDYLVRVAGLHFNIFLGTSVGALNAVFLSQAGNKKELGELIGQLKQFWLAIKGNRSIYNSFCSIFNLLFNDSLYIPRGLKRLLHKCIDLDRVFDPATIVKITTVAIETGDLAYIDNRRPELRADFLNYVLASASVPLFFPPVHIGGKHWYDGGLRDITPLGAVFKEEPDEIVVIVTYPVGLNFDPILPRVKPKGAFKTILRSIDILTSEIATNDIQLANLLNQNHHCMGYRKIPILLIHPPTSLPGNDALDFSRAAIAENIKLGFEAARNPRRMRLPLTTQIK
jgi:NTE family protein